MRLVTYRNRGDERAGAVVGDWVVDLERAAAVLDDPTGVATGVRGTLPATLRGLLQLEERGMSLASRLIAAVVGRLDADAEDLREAGVLLNLQEVRLAPPIPDPGKIICLGHNYRAHAEETGGRTPVAPELFAKYANTLIGHREPIQIPKVTDQVDYEAELAVVIGRRGHDIAAEDAQTYIAGYTILNDVSAREYQFMTTQWLAGKSFDTFGPVGPWIVTRDEVPDPHDLRITLSVDGDTLQDSHTGQMIFTIPATIAFVSQIMTLEPGDIISTGTPEGVGFVRKPPRFLRPGETVQVTIERVGTLENPVVAAAEGDGSSRQIAPQQAERSPRPAAAS